MTHLHIMKKKTFLYFLEENFLFYYPAKKKIWIGPDPTPCMEKHCFSSFLFNPSLRNMLTFKWLICVKTTHTKTNNTWWNLIKEPEFKF